MKFVRSITALGMFLALFLIGFTPSAQALPGDSAVEPLVVTDPELVPDTADFIVVGCKDVYSWSVYTPGFLLEDGETYVEEETKYYSYTDMTECWRQVNAKVIVIDRCGWRRDVVRVRHDDRILFTMVTQVTKTRWRVHVRVEEDFVLDNTWRQTATYSYWLTNRRCR